MTDAEIKSALEALSLTEADSDDVRIVADPNHGTLLIATYKTVKYGTQVVLVSQDKGASSWTRTRLSATHADALYQVLSTIDND